MHSVSNRGTAPLISAAPPPPTTAYVATRWVAVCFLPLILLRSERIRPFSEFVHGVDSHVRYAILGRVPRHWPQIARTYLAGRGTLAWFVSLWWLYAPVEKFFGNRPFLIPLLWISLPLAVIVVWHALYMPRPKLKPVEISPGSEFAIYRRDDDKKT